MKGPGMRLDLDVRRVWRCPACGHERRTSGDRTIVPCTTCPERPLMSLVERKRSPRPLRPLPDVLIAFDLDEADLLSLDSPAAPPETATSPTEVTSRTEHEASHETAPQVEPSERQPKKRQRRRRTRRRPSGKDASDTSTAPATADEDTPSAHREISAGDAARPGSGDDERLDPC
jgi:hypothetical protein